jgi:hypothetical protein
VVWSLNSGLTLLGRLSYCLSHSTSSFCNFFFFWARVSCTICLGLILNHDPPDPCLLCS